MGGVGCSDWLCITMVTDAALSVATVPHLPVTFRSRKAGAGALKLEPESFLQHESDADIPVGSSLKVLL